MSETILTNKMQNQRLF